MNRISQETKLGIFFIAVVVLVTVGYLWYKSWAPGIMDEGPLKGEEFSSVPSGAPAQSYQIYDGMLLEVYDSHNTHGAPVVSAVNSSGERLWTVLATSSKKDPKLVHSLRFSRARAFPFVSPRVRGEAVVQDVSATTWWFISKRGELKEYWYAR